MVQNYNTVFLIGPIDSSGLFSLSRWRSVGGHLTEGQCFVETPKLRAFFINKGKLVTTELKRQTLYWQ